MFVGFAMAAVMGGLGRFHADTKGAAAVNAEEEAEPTVYTLGVCAVIRDEALYLEEWILFHELVGVQHFFLMDDGSTDETRAVLAPFISRGLVTYFDWRFHVRSNADDDDWDCDSARLATDPARLNNCQLRAFDECLIRQSHAVEWLAFIDVDEFLYPTLESDTSVADVLRRQFSHVTHSVGVVSATYGSSGHVFRASGPVTAAHVHRSAADSVSPASAAELFKIKSIMRPSAGRAGRCGSHLFHDVRDDDSSDELPHAPLRTIATDGVPFRGCGDATHDPQHCLLAGCGVLAPQWAMLRYNHYRVKSREDYESRSYRGVVQGRLATKKSAISFRMLDANDETDNALWHRFGDALSSRLALHRGGRPMQVIAVVGADRVEVPFVAASLGLAGATPGDAASLNRPSTMASPYLYPAGFWLSSAVEAAHEALAAGDPERAQEIAARHVERSLKAHEPLLLQDDGLLCAALPMWAAAAARANASWSVVSVGDAQCKGAAESVAFSASSDHVDAVQRLVQSLRIDRGLRLWSPPVDRLVRLYDTIRQLESQ